MNGCAVKIKNKLDPNPKELIDVLTPLIPEKLKIKKHKELYYQDDNEKVLLLTLSYIPYKTIKEYIRFVDIHLIRELPKSIEGEKCTLRMMCILEEAHLLIKSRVQALGGNALIGYKIINLEIDRDINSLSRINISISGTAVKYE